MTFALHDLSRQLDGMVGYLAQTRPDREARAATAMASFEAVCAGWQGITAEVEHSHLGYLAALPHEDPGAFFPPAELQSGFSVAASDGSQIEPERHHMAEFFVLNVGWAVLHYGEGSRAELGNAPEVRFRSEDLDFEVNGRRIPIRAELLAILRSVLERRKLADLLEAIPAERTAIGLADGSLLDWTLETRAADLPPEVERDMLAQFDRIRASGHLLASYVSRPASRDVANLARVPLCSDRPDMDCRHCTSRAAKGVADCDAVDGLHDADLLWQRRLPPYHRSALFQPRQRVQERYG
ncbi:MAG TPA: DNA double-strand break repair nuclease NurA, partial [Chloroflexota bacterium]